MASKFDAEPVPVHQLFEGRNTLYKIPEYQRPYSWEKSHIDQLWDDLYKAWDNSGDVDDSYFLGTIILVDNGNDRLDILDGQQRITTLMIFYAVLRDFFDEELSGQRNRINRRIEESPDSDDSKYRLMTGEKHHDVFESTVLSSVNLDEQNRYTEAVKYTKNALEDKFDDPDELEDFFDFVEEDTEIIQIETSELSYAIRLFQTVNNRGKDLTVSDLTKSYLLSLTSDEQRDIVTESWKKLSSKFDDDYDRLDSVLSSYRLHLQDAKAEEAIYEELKSEFDASLEEGTSVVEIARDINKYAEEYRNVENEESREMYMMSNLSHSQQWKTILTTAKKEGFSEYDELVDALVGLYYSYWVGGHNSQKIKRPSYKILRKIKDGEGIEGIRDYIESKRSGDDIAQKVQNNLYSEVYGENWHRPLLLALEYNLSVDKKTGEIKPGQDIHIEHILPKSYETAMEKKEYWREQFDPEEAAKLRHTLGNLTPLEQEVHDVVLQKPFRTKKAHYMGKDDTLASLGDDREATSFDLTRRVVDEYEDWNPENIREHRNFIVEQSADLLNFETDRLLQVEEVEVEIEP
ncbi:DUF262 domain-containing protein [Haloarcula sp. CBA1127]|uniref:DUF262 domain-containing protein n=1 Tax=Haloarcula sp. CBA1127 TaxID=1765055 RepID=UPI00073F4F0D|nr:DUF262 domain-containing protein [Haloarcula sp. CBA1127]